MPHIPCQVEPADFMYTFYRAATDWMAPEADQDAAWANW